ncbi:MAG: Mut7-C ubiquitin/RNAse domain-containing protein [Proteobacteria bacterium]|nr:Mut7-C ubiquitin/RNAse domain-containing protein [Pseudomonadota bacterium]MBU1708452.1 Mut7-C ubiquitin/RNAse domain-containing protein [Pseudomonadota bacterium]
MKHSTLIFHGDLPKLLKHRFRGENNIQYAKDRPTSIKDVIESLGIPHTEIGQILTDKSEIDFAQNIQDLDEIHIFPCMPPVNLRIPSLLRPGTIEKTAFIVDVNVGKLAGLLRLCGFDAVTVENQEDEAIARNGCHENRIILTRDKELLKRKIVMFGRLVRNTEPIGQLKEIITLYDLHDEIKPFSRCMHCNGMLAAVTKEEIIHRLEPLTKKYFDVFQQCRSCGRIYWPGSHHEKLQALIDAARK